MGSALLGALMLPLSQALAAPLAFSSAPAGTGNRKPAPNLIVSVDDSGSMGPTGMRTLRNALVDTFSEANVPDGAIRLAWQSMARCYTIPSGGDCNGHNEMRVLDSVHRSHFRAWVATLDARSGTASHRMLFNAGEYLRMPPGVNSPWASAPGTTQEPMLGCRRSYNLFMTDGGWNSPFGNQAGDVNDRVRWNASNPSAGASILNADGTSRLLGDGMTPYDVTLPHTQIYRDKFGADLYTDSRGSGVLPTFSDLAFHYWATDLQPELPNNVPTHIVQEGDATITDGTLARAVPEFWNPRNDPATWQHMTLYTLGFNNAADGGRFASSAFAGDTWSGDDYKRLLLGTANWPNPLEARAINDDRLRVPELWHAALNARGKFIPAPTGTSLAVAVKDVLNTIDAEKGSVPTSIAGSSNSTRAASMSFEADYSADGWRGAVTAYNVAAATGVVSRAGAWGATTPAVGNPPSRPVSTAARLDAEPFMPDDRLVLSHDGAAGIAWTWANLSNAQKSALHALGSTVDHKGEDRLAFLRGDRSKEAMNGGTFRNRKSRHGDIVNSSLWVAPGKPASGHVDTTYQAFRSTHSGRPSMLYVGANDGMLHGFAAADGTEKIAYVPNGLHAALPQLTSVNYEHRYYVDGSPFTGDLKAGADMWKTYLVGFLGAGGRGFFVLDVTDPTAFSVAAPANLVVMDKTGPEIDPDVGHIFSQPVMDRANSAITQQITLLNNGRWALIAGNGYNSANERAVLVIQYLDGDKAMVKIGAGARGGNGLGAPRLVDLNGDRKPDIAYAGDLQGNLWAFDLTSLAPDGWKVAFDGAPLYVARDTTRKPQPITAAPVWLPHPNGGRMVVFGTGRNLTNADRSDTAAQSIYGIHDSTVILRDAFNKVTFSGGAPITDGRDALVAQTAGAEAGAAHATGHRLWKLSSNSVEFTGKSARKGWYFDLPVAGERVVGNLEWFDGQLVDVASMVPATDGNTTSETCGPVPVNGRGYVTTLNAITGSAPTSQIYGYSAIIDTVGSHKTASRIESSLRHGLKTDRDVIGVCASGQSCDDRQRLGNIGLRPAWRQLQ